MAIKQIKKIKVKTMPHDKAYFQAEKKIQTMIEGLHDYPDWARINHGNPSIKKITVKTKGGKYGA